MDTTLTEFATQIRTLAPIQPLMPVSQNEVIEHADIVEFSQGQYVFREGDRDAFLYFLLRGELEMLSNGSLVNRLLAGSESALHALAQLQPRQFSASARTPITVLRLDRRWLEELILRDRERQKETDGIQVSEIGSKESNDWMTRILQSELFKRLPPANIQHVLTRMKSVRVQPNTVVVRQNAPGDYWYIIGEGRCEINRSNSTQGTPAKLRELE
jgi:CRP-like cAMP-binding protein